MATVAQLGYALGLLLVVPLGDILPRRPLLAMLILGTAGALLAAAGAPALPVLLVATLLASGLTVVPQILVPLVTELVPAHRRGRAVATVQAGLLTGILLARVIGGQIGQHAGWRTTYLVAAGATATIGTVTVLLVPHDRPRHRIGYRKLLGSLLPLLRTEPVLRQACLLQALCFGVFSIFWTTLVFLLTGPPYRYDTGTAALIGLVGLLAVVTAPLVGRLADRYGPLTALGATTGALAAATVLFAAGQHGIGFALAGTALLNAGVQGSQIANQTRIFALRPDARNRLNTVYMVSTFAAGSAGAALGDWLYQRHGWAGPSTAGVSGALLALALWAVLASRSRPGHPTLTASGKPLVGPEPINDDGRHGRP